MGLPLRHLIPAATAGLLAPLAPLAASAGELNLEAVNRYARSATGQSQEQVTSINQFSDVKPTDWAYQALSNLIERYGCVAGYPNGTYKGGQAMTRYEAAALLNACLDRITEVTDELKRLMAEFEKELAVLRGRVDGLEAKVGELEATQFSTTTKLSGQATFVIGANAFSGSDTLNVDAARAAVGATTFSYDIQLSFDTSFTGKDLLRTILRAGNFADSAFGGAGPTGGLSTLEAAFQEDCGIGVDCGDVVAIDKIFYQFPIGSQFTATFGGRVGQEDMLALWPSAYPSDTILNLFTLNGAPAAYNKNLGPGAGLWWQQGGFSISANYVAANGDVGDPNIGGIGTVASAGTGTVQIGYAREQWGLAAIYSRIQSGVGVPGTTPFTGLTYEANPNSRTDAFGVSGYWQPANSGWIPSISLGWGINGTSYDTAQAPGALRTSQSWMVGLQWDDAFVKGNALGMAVGQPVFATALADGQTPQDGNFAWEWWYKWQVTDNISVTPALFYLSRPLGQFTTPDTSFRQLGGLVKTTFRF
ncbi:iron uptake porin [Aphanothece minutissima]|uniref:Porin n=1 Tax=Aphanothece cf. minutissima CCALA 015 TaxID=2107695 RepID=A0ABX5F4M4_9CHRO|nr:iron uptake porin [Aphanothece minutissima]PSB36340.1 porin [Aphanothece cf. minutissima CCALA 015]